MRYVLVLTLALGSLFARATSLELGEYLVMYEGPAKYAQVEAELTSRGYEIINHLEDLATFLVRGPRGENGLRDIPGVESFEPNRRVSVQNPQRPKCEPPLDTKKRPS